MRRFGIGVRWWFAVAFAVVAAASAAIVVTVFSSRSEQAFRGRAEELAAGRAFVAAQAVASALAAGVPASTAVAETARTEHLALFLYDRSGRLAAAAGAGVSVRDDAAAARARRGSRYVASSDNGRRVVVAVPLRVPGYAGLVARSVRAELPAELGIVRHEALWAGVFAGVAGAAIGLLLAQLISLRLRRLAAAADAVRAGRFDTPLSPGFPDEFGSVAAAFERMRAELARSFGRLEFERDRLRLLLERLEEGVITVDRRLTVHFANSEARRILGTPAAEGEPLADVDGLRLRELATRLFDESSAPEQERVTLTDGRTISVAGIPARAGAETALIVLVDLTEALRRERSEREFVANAAHELRTPLTTIIGAVEMLQAGAKDDPAERDRFLAHIERESDRLARLTRALLVLARAQSREEPPPLKRVELRPLLAEVASSLRPHEGVAVEVDCAPGLAVVTNRDLLEQALRNLGDNAAKHTSAGLIRLAAAPTRAVVRIRVDDTGRGIARDAQRRVFERFARGNRRDADGFGLGLAIVRQAVQALGGRVDLDSAPGRGTRFTITLPNAAAQEEAA